MEQVLFTPRKLLFFVLFVCRLLSSLFTLQFITFHTAHDSFFCSLSRFVCFGIIHSIFPPPGPLGISYFIQNKRVALQLSCGDSKSIVSPLAVCCTWPTFQHLSYNIFFKESRAEFSQRAFVSSIILLSYQNSL